MLSIFHIYYISTTVSRNNGDAEWHICTYRGRAMREKEQARDVKQGKRMSEWTNERTSDEHPVCICLSNTHICIRFITISHQVADISTQIEGMEAWFLADMLMFTAATAAAAAALCEWCLWIDWFSNMSDGVCLRLCLCGCVGLLFLSHLLVGLVVQSSQSCPFVVRLSGRIIDDFLTV